MSFEALDHRDGHRPNMPLCYLCYASTGIRPSAHARRADWQTRDKRLREGVPVDEEPWRQLEEIVRTLGLSREGNA